MVALRLIYLLQHYRKIPYYLNTTFSFMTYEYNNLLEINPCPDANPNKSLEKALRRSG